MVEELYQYLDMGWIIYQNAYYLDLIS